MMKKQKLLIIAGAGAAVEFGMPSVRKINDLFATWADDYFKIIDNDDNLYNYIRNRIVQYNSTHKRSDDKAWPNFEEMVYIILFLALLKKNDYYNQYVPFVTLDEFPEIHYFNIEKRNVSWNILEHLASHLIDKLLDYIREKCIDIASDSNNRKMQLLKHFLNRLAEYYEIGIVTINYNNLFLQAKSDWFTGFDKKGCFSPYNVLKRQKWNFVYHIHGSVHFDMKNDQFDMHKVYWKNDLGKNFNQNSSGRSSNSTLEGLSFPTSNIIVGYGKNYQIQRLPFRIYYSVLDRLVLEADKFLIIGYGFGDYHINNSLNLITENRRRKVVIIDYADDYESPLEVRNDFWARNLFMTISGKAFEMSSQDGKSLPDIGDLKQTMQFEVSINPDYPLSIWYNGFLDACKNVDKILMELE